MRFPRLMLAASGLATAALLGSSVAANAASMPAPVNGPFTTMGEAGYQISSGTVSFNEVRATLHIPAGSETSSVIGLQENVNGGDTFAVGLINKGGNFYLEGLQRTQLNGQTGVPFPDGVNAKNFVNAFTPLSTIGVPAGTPLFSDQTGGSYFVELHYSTRRHLVQIVAGPAENDAAVLETQGAYNFSGVFNAPAVETVNFGGGTLPVSTPQASFTRVGVTEPAGFNFGGIAGARVTFDHFALNEAEATQDGGPASIANHVVLFADPALPGIGSAFGIITGH